MSKIIRVSYSSSSKNTFKVVTEENEIFYVPKDEQNSDYKKILDFVIKGGIIDPYENEILEYKEKISNKLFLIKESKKVLTINKEDKSFNIQLTDSKIDLLKNKTIQAKFSKDAKIDFSFSLIDESTNEVIFFLHSPYSSEGTEYIDSFSFLSKLSYKIEEDLLSKNFIQYNSTLKQISSCSSIEELKSLEDSIDSIAFVDGLKVNYSDLL